jgi:hypothetical protein
VALICRKVSSICVLESALLTMLGGEFVQFMESSASDIVAEERALVWNFLFKKQGTVLGK